MEDPSSIYEGEYASHRSYQFIKVRLFCKLATTRQIKPVAKPLYGTVQGTILPSLEKISYLGPGLMVNWAIRPDKWHSHIHYFLDAFSTERRQKKSPSISLQGREHLLAIHLSPIGIRNVNGISHSWALSFTR